MDILDKLVKMRPSDYETLKLIIKKCEGDIFISGKHEEYIISKLKISKRTYQRRIKYFVGEGILVQDYIGIYKLNKTWIRVFEQDTKNKQAGILTMRKENE